MYEDGEGWTVEISSQANEVGGWSRLEGYLRVAGEYEAMVWCVYFVAKFVLLLHEEQRKRIRSLCLCLRLSLSLFLSLALALPRPPLFPSVSVDEPVGPLGQTLAR